MTDSRKIIKYAISWKRLAVEQNGWKIGTCFPANCICKILLGSGTLNSFWDHSVHFENFSMLRFSKGCCSPSFHPILTLQKACIRGRYRLIIVKTYGTLKISHLSYFTSIHKAVLVSFGKRSIWADRQGPWASCSSLHIAFLELETVFLVLKRLQGWLCGTHVLVQMDSTRSTLWTG